MKTIMRSAFVGLVAAFAAACEGPVDPDPDPIPTPPQQQQCSVTPAQLPGTGGMRVLGLGCVSNRYTSELWVHGGWAYTGTWGRRGSLRGDVLYVWNVTGDAPVLQDSLSVGQATTLGDVQVSDDGRLLVVATEGGDGSIVIYDLANPAKPVQIVRHVTDNTRPGVHTADLARVSGTLYAVLSVTSRGTVVIVDLSDPRNPREVSVFQTGLPFTHDVLVRDGLLFTAGWTQGTRVWDVGGGGRGGSPAGPVLLQTFANQGGRAHNVWWFHDPTSGAKRYLFVGEEGAASIPTSSSGDIHVLDIANPAAPREVAFYSVPGAGTHNFSVDEKSGILYVAYYNGGVRALDIRGDLGGCTAEQKDASGRCDLRKMGREVATALESTSAARSFVWGVQLVGDRLYASDMLNGLWKLDVSALKR